jgi:LuxR family transcriptional regulator, maltose regulon positive regulatory protein
MAAEDEPGLEAPRWHGAEEPPPLAEAKLAAPRLRDGLVERGRVLRLLDAGLQATLTLVAAPAGYGKTTAVRAWCAHRGAPLAWVTLDAGDNDPVRLWRYVATAIARVHPGLGRPALRRLDMAAGSIESPIDEVMNALATFGDELVLVLDDVQTVTDLECLASIDYALGRLPATAHLILLTRADPALRLPQLRAGGRLTEVRAADLAFAGDEAHQLLVDRLGVRLDAEEV